MEHMSSGRGVKPGVLAGDRDGNNALFFANAIYVAKPSVPVIAESQPADLVYSFIPKHIHPPKIFNVMAYVLPDHVPGQPIKKASFIGPAKRGSALNCAAQCSTKLPPFAEPVLL